jgi:hypothetical protein
MLFLFVLKQYFARCKEHLYYFSCSDQNCLMEQFTILYVVVELLTSLVKLVSCIIKKCLFIKFNYSLLVKSHNHFR